MFGTCNVLESFKTHAIFGSNMHVQTQVLFYIYINVGLLLCMLILNFMKIVCNNIIVSMLPKIAFFSYLIH